MSSILYTLYFLFFALALGIITYRRFYPNSSFDRLLVLSLRLCVAGLVIALLVICLGDFDLL